jgi:hypothetical protein
MSNPVPPASCDGAPSGLLAALRDLITQARQQVLRHVDVVLLLRVDAPEARHWYMQGQTLRARTFWRWIARLLLMGHGLVRSCLSKVSGKARPTLIAGPRCWLASLVQ